MDNSEKSRIIVDSLIDTIIRGILNAKKANKDLIKSLKKTKDKEKGMELITESVVQSIQDINVWKKKGIPGIDGLTPGEYFQTLDSVEDIVELITLIYTKNENLIPTGLINNIKSLDETSTDELVQMLNSIDISESGHLTDKHHALLQIVNILGLPKFILPLLEIISQLYEEKSEREDCETLMDAMRRIGQPALEPLISFVEKSKREGIVYSYLIMTIGDIASKNKSDRYYNLLKGWFRNSDDKYSEALALGTYGDGRSIPAIRGFVQKNLDKMDYWNYEVFRDIIIELGGQVDDFEEYFSERAIDEDFDE